MPNTPGTLLIADDESSIRESLSQVLSEIGYSVRTAEDGFSALREIQSEVPELLLSDLNMPGALCDPASLSRDPDDCDEWFFLR